MKRNASEGRAAARRIHQAVAEVRRHVSRGLALAVAAWCVSAVLGLMALAPWLSGSGGWSAGSPGPLLLVSAVLAVGGAGFAAWRRIGRRWSAEHRITRAIDAVAGLHEGETLAGLELSRSAPEGTSPGLRTLAMHLVGDRLAGGSKTLSGSLGRRVEAMAKRAAASLAVAVPTVGLVAALAPVRTFQAWDGLLHPIAVLAEPVLPPVSVEPGTAEVARGAVVEVVVHAPLRDSVRLQWDVTGQVADGRTLVFESGEGRSVQPPINAETRYWAEAPDGERSPVHVLTPVDPLFVGTFTLELAYPPHTGLQDDEYRNEAPPLVLPAGTRLRIRGEGSRQIGRGVLVDEDGRVALAFAVEGARFQGSWIPARSGVYAWEFADAMGGPAATAPQPLTLEVAPDRLPQVEIVYPAPDTILPVEMRQPLVVRAQDDYGLQRVEIVARRITAIGEEGEPVTRGVEMGGTAGAIIRPLLDVSDWRLSPGDAIRYRARVTDNHPSGQTAETPEHVLRMPEVSEIERAAQAELERAAEEVRSLAEDAERAEQEARDLQARSEAERNGRDGRENGFESREEVAEALERQDRIMSAVDSLQRELAELREALRDAGVADPELADRIEGLEERLEDAAPEDRRDALAERMEQLSEMDPQALQEALDRIVAEQEEMRRRLEASVEQFRQAALDQDFRATSQEAEELADEQELLADAMREGGEDSLRAEQQQVLEQDAAELQQRLETLQQRLAEAGEQEAGAGVQEARHQLSQARRQMTQAGEMASQGQSQSAAEQAQEAAGDMSRVSQELSEAMMQMQQQMMQALRNALGRTAVDALALARRQSELREQMVGATASETAALRGDEAAIAQGLRNLAESYAADTEMAAPGARDLMTAVGEAMEGLDRTIEAMENRRARGPSPAAGAETVVRALNEVARLAMTSGQQGQSQGAATASEQMMQQLQQLAQQQGEIMQDASSLSPMRLGEETMSRQVDEMAARQEDVARELEEMSESEGEGEEEGGPDPLGDLSAFAEEAQRLAEALASGRLDPEVLRRQERLFHRLLDAGRSLERDEESEERESEVPGEFSRERAGPLTDADLDVLRFRLPDADALRALPPAHRALVISYFERLNRTDAWATDADRPTAPGGQGG